MRLVKFSRATGSTDRGVLVNEKRVRELSPDINFYFTEPLTPFSFRKDYPSACQASFVDKDGFKGPEPPVNKSQGSLLVSRISDNDHHAFPVGIRVGRRAI